MTDFHEMVPIGRSHSAECPNGKPFIAESSSERRLIAAVFYNALEELLRQPIVIFDCVLDGDKFEYSINISNGKEYNSARHWFLYEKMKDALSFEGACDILNMKKGKITKHVLWIDEKRKRLIDQSKNFLENGKYFEQLIGMSREDFESKTLAHMKEKELDTFTVGKSLQIRNTLKESYEKWFGIDLPARV